MDKFLGNKDNKKLIDAFLTQSDATVQKHRLLIIIGPVGAGKTTFCNIALNNHADTIRWFSPYLENIDSHKDLVQQCENFLTTDNVNVCPNAPKAKHKLIFFDDVDILFSHDRYANSFIQKLVDMTPEGIECIEGMPLFIVTCAAGDERRLTDLKKKCKNILRLENPSVTEIVAKYGAEFEEKARKHDCNITHMLQGNEVNHKYFDKNIYQIVENIFAEDDGLVNLEQAISNDPTLISFMMYDNYRKIYSKQPDAAAFDRITKTYMDCSVLEDFAYNTSDWNLIEATGLMRCQTIRLLNGSGYQVKKGPPPTYTQITSRSAQHYCMNKKLNALRTTNYRNVELLAALMHQTKQKTDKSNLGLVCNAFIYNFCKK